jgi:hypothetical protein
MDCSWEDIVLHSLLALDLQIKGKSQLYDQNLNI